MAMARMRRAGLAAAVRAAPARNCEILRSWRVISIADMMPAPRIIDVLHRVTFADGWESHRSQVLRRLVLEEAPKEGPQAMVRLLARVVGVGVETADMLVHEILSRDLRDQRAVARYAGLTGSPDESGKRSRDKGLAKAGNARVRRGMIQLAWRFLRFQRNSALAQWYRAVTKDARGAIRKTMIVAVARKLLIALWRMVTIGKMPENVTLRAA